MAAVQYLSARVCPSRNQKEKILKVLLLDIETAPNKVWTWGLFNQNIAINQIEEPGYVLCWAAKWLGEKEIHFSSIEQDGPVMLDIVHDLISSADVIIHWNGTSFDLPTLNQEFMTAGLGPPAPVTEIDLLLTARKRFRLLSNKLDYVAQYLGVGKKVSHEGMELWLKCMRGDAKAWAKMKKYNIQDVKLLEDVYNYFLPWIPNHPNRGLYSEGLEMVCPNCGSARSQKRGLAYTKTMTYQRYQCLGCGSWFRERFNNLSKDKRATVVVGTG